MVISSATFREGERNGCIGSRAGQYMDFTGNSNYFIWTLLKNENHYELIFPSTRVNKVAYGSFSALGSYFSLVQFGEI